MRKSKVFLSVATFISVCFMLVGCGPVYQTNYSYITPKSWRGKKCVNRCLRDRSYCRERCHAHDQSCRNAANLTAMPQYLAYMEQQRNNNLPINQDVSDFADYSNCSDHCGCESTYRQCFTNCGGEVIANTQCVAFCKK